VIGTSARLYGELRQDRALRAHDPVPPLAGPRACRATLPPLSRIFPPEISEFIYRYCPSLQHLAILLCIHADDSRTWTPGDVHSEVRELDEREARDLLAAFYGQGLLTAVAVDTYRYAPSSPELARGVAALAQAHAERPAAVLKEVARLEGLGPIRSFSDAFVIRKGRRRG
jgi:hypothetical protein